jgi:hypothetical protein
MDIREGDWVRTSTGKEGRIVLISRLSAFIDYRNKVDSGPASCLLSDLTKIETPNLPEILLHRPTKIGVNMAAVDDVEVIKNYCRQARD